MTNYFLGLAQRTLGLRESLQPSIASMFEPGMLLMDDYVPVEAMESEAITGELSSPTEPQYGQTAIEQLSTSNMDAQFFFRAAQPQLNEASFDAPLGIEQGDAGSFFDSITARAGERFDPVQRSESRSFYSLPKSASDWGMRLPGIPAEWNSELDRDRQNVPSHTHNRSLDQPVEANLTSSDLDTHSYGVLSLQSDRGLSSLRPLDIANFTQPRESTIEDSRGDNGSSMKLQSSKVHFRGLTAKFAVEAANSIRLGTTLYTGDSFSQENYGNRSNSLAVSLVKYDRFAPISGLGRGRAINEALKNRFSFHNHTTVLNPNANQNIVSSIDKSVSDRLPFHSDAIDPSQTVHSPNRAILSIVQGQIGTSEDRDESIKELASLNSNSQTSGHRLDASVLGRQDSRSTDANQPSLQPGSRIDLLHESKMPTEWNSELHESKMPTEWNSELDRQSVPSHTKQLLSEQSARANFGFIAANSIQQDIRAEVREGETPLEASIPIEQINQFNPSDERLRSSRPNSGDLQSSTREISNSPLTRLSYTSQSNNPELVGHYRDSSPPKSPILGDFEGEMLSGVGELPLAQSPPILGDLGGISRPKRSENNLYVHDKLALGELPLAQSPPILGDLGGISRPKRSENNLHHSKLIQRARDAFPAQFSSAIDHVESHSPEHTAVSSIRTTAPRNQAKDIENALPNQEVWNETTSDTARTTIEPTSNHRLARQQSSPVLVKQNFAIAPSATTQPTSQAGQSIPIDSQVQSLVHSEIQSPKLSRDRIVSTHQETEFLASFAPRSVRIPSKKSNAPLSSQDNEEDSFQTRKKREFSDPAPRPPMPRAIAYFRPALKLDDYLKRRQGGRS